LKAVTFILSIFITSTIYCQEYSYKQYTTADGLPSNVVYAAFQDSLGYIWFCTNAGVSRFNGISFQNFTVEDGLSDNEVFGAFQTGSGKIWFRTFSNKLCYYENGSFHNYKTDPWLNSSFGGLRLPFIDKQGRGWSRDYIDAFVYVLDEKKKLIEKIPYHLKDSTNIIVSPREVDTILREEERVVYGKIYALLAKNKAEVDKLSDAVSYLMYMRKFLHGLQMEHPSLSLHYLYLLYISSNPVFRFKLHDLILPTDPKDHSYWITHANKGIIRGKDFYNLQEQPEVYLQDHNINNVLVDKEGNYWFTSPTEGVFFLNAHAVKTHNPGIKDAEIYSVTGNSNYIICGNNNEVLFINRNTRAKFSWRYDLVKNSSAYNRIKDMLIDGEDRCWLASDIGIVCLRFSEGKVQRIYPVNSLTLHNELYVGAMKALARGKGGKIYFGSHARLNSIEADMKIKKLAFKRITAIVELPDNSVLVGSNDGLHLFKDDKLIPYPDKKYDLTQHITDLALAPSGFVCAATNDRGLIVKKENEFFYITASDTLNRLTSNICRKVFIDSANDIWACTNKGLCRLTITSWKPFSYRVQQFTTDDGLISNDVNDVFVSNDSVWVATSGGLSYFSEPEVKTEGTIPLIYISRADTLMNRTFPHRTKIAIGLEGISFESIGKLRYRYRIKGLYQDWRYTDRNQLLYDVLPPGRYELEVYSINRFGQESSKPATATFTIAAPWWATGWAYALYFFSALVILIAAFMLVRHNSRRKERDRMKHIQQLQQLELKALRSQMNPHFIFNTLNAVQKYILENDKEASYRYLTRFSKLIRSFLENSRQTTISLKDELDLLRSYMEMEALRFRNKFRYEVTIDASLDPAYIYIPSMLIQPYVENAIWHGIQHKQANGFVKLSVQDLGGNVLKCTVQDNGIGRKRAGEIESASGSQHQPVGMTITQQRLEIINERLKQVSVNFIDIGDNNPGSGSGTIVELIVTYLTKKP
jgi:ligand-binding sensor domain-containing protein/two-component sensor histidine kinase